jgi:hypothetical protein
VRFARARSGLLPFLVSLVRSSLSARAARLSLLCAFSASSGLASAFFFEFSAPLVCLGRALLERREERSRRGAKDAEEGAERRTEDAEEAQRERTERREGRRTGRGGRALRSCALRPAPLSRLSRPFFSFGSRSAPLFPLRPLCVLRLALGVLLRVLRAPLSSAPLPLLASSRPRPPDRRSVQSSTVSAKFRKRTSVAPPECSCSATMPRRAPWGSSRSTHGWSLIHVRTREPRASMR